MEIQCPNCKTFQQMPEAYKGKIIKCIECKATFSPDISGLNIHHKNQAKPNLPQIEYSQKESGNYLIIVGTLIIFLGGIPAFLDMVDSKDLAPFYLAIIGGFILCGLGTIANILEKLIPPRIKDKSNSKKN